MQKLCPTCKKTKPIAEFAKKGNGFQHQCKECKRHYNKNEYQRNKQYYIAKARRRDIAIRELVNSYKTKCSRCPETHPACLQFHHRDPAKKKFTISISLRHSQHGLQAIKEEIEKCDVLCANCHFKEHWRCQIMPDTDTPRTCAKD